MVKLPGKVEKGLAEAGGFLLLVMTLLVTADVALRYFLRKPIGVSIPVVELLQVGAVFLAMAYAQAVREHIKIMAIVERLPGRVRGWLAVVADFLMLVFFAMILAAGTRIAGESWDIRESVYAGGTLVPIYPGKIVLVLGVFLLCLRLIWDIVGQLRRGAHPPQQVG